MSFNGLNGGINKLNLWEKVIEVIRARLVDKGSAHEIAALSFDEGCVKVVGEDWLIDIRVLLAFVNNGPLGLGSEEIGKVNTVWVHFDVSLNGVLWDLGPDGLVVLANVWCNDVVFTFNE